MKNIFTIIFFAIVTTCNAQINTFFVAPNQSDINYTVQDSHLIVRNLTTNVNKLFLFIGGTGSNPGSYETISNFVGGLGYDVINLSYINTVAAFSLTNSSDSLVFDKYRQEICYGTPESSDIEVDTFNSIYTRTVKLINYLHETYPDQNWNQYLDFPNTLNWSKIVVGGHSQGSGHACYFGKFNPVERVLMFSGPNDYSTYFSNSAKWIRTPGITGVEKQFAYLSILDELVDFEKQLFNLQSLNLFPTYDTIYIDNSNSPYSNSHCLYTDQNPGFAILHHNTPVKNSTINETVWTYMLESVIISGLSPIEINNTIRVFPNPTNSLLNIISEENFADQAASVFNINGQFIRSEKITAFKSISIDLSDLPNGLYFIGIDDRYVKVVKY